MAPYSLLVSLAHLLSLAPLFLAHLLASYPLAAAAEYLTPAALQPFASLKVDLAFIWAFFAFDQFLYVFFLFLLTLITSHKLHRSTGCP